MVTKFTMGGKPITLLGKELKVGDRAPSFKLIGNELNVLTNDLFFGKVVILSCIPSVDTPVCSLETRHFNKEASKLSDDIRIITVSKDLPFAQSRWCAAHGVENIIMASDYRDFGFAKDYGVLIEETGLLARAVFVLTKQGKIAYIQKVPEIAQEPMYAPILAVAKEIVKGLKR